MATKDKAKADRKPAAERKAKPEANGKPKAEPKPKGGKGSPTPLLTRIPIEGIHHGPAEGVRHGPDPATVEEFAAADLATPGCLPPVDVFAGPDVVYLADGSTRLAALSKNKRTETPAQVRKYPTDDAARIMAIAHASKANANHGRRRTDADKHAAVRQYLLTEDWGDRTDEQAAEECGGVHPSIIRDERAKLTQSGRLAGKASATRYKKHWNTEAKTWADGYSHRGKLAPVPTASAPTARPIEEGENPEQQAFPELETEPPPTGPGTSAATAGEANEWDGDGRPLDVLGELSDAVARVLRICTVSTVGRLAYLLNRPGTLRGLTAEDRADLAKRIRELDAPAGAGAVDAGHYDSHGKPVPKQLALVFSATATYDAFGQRFGRLLGDVERATVDPEQPGCHLMSANVIRQQSEAIKAEIYAGRPDAVCPDCGPKFDAEPGRTAGEPGCKWCAGRGWLSRSMFHQLPKAVQKRCEAEQPAQ